MSGSKSFGDELRATLRLAWPIVAGNIGQILIGVIDTLMVGRIGVTALGASAFVNNVFMPPLIVLIGLLTAVPIVVSQAKGKGDDGSVKESFRHGLVLSLIVGFLFLIGLLGNYFALHLYGQESAVVSESRSYYILIAVSLIPIAVYQMGKGFCEGLGRSNAPMVILLCGIGLNVILNWILIFGHFGFEAMGLEGAGWASLVARVLIAATMLIYIAKSARFRAWLPAKWLQGIGFMGMRPLLRLGVPASLQHLFEAGAFSIAGIMIGWLGEGPLAAHQIAISCAALAFMIPLGVSAATGIRVGDCFGRGDVEGIRRIALGGLVFTGGQTLVSAALFLVFGKTLAEMFVDDTAVVGQAAAIFVVVGIFQIFDGSQVVGIGALRGMSDVVVTTFITFLAYWVVAIPIGYWLGFSREFGAVGIWVGLAIGLLFASVFLLGRLWQKARVASA